MTLSFSSIRNSLPIPGIRPETAPHAAVLPEHSEVGYVDTQQDGRLTPPVLTINTPEAFEDIQEAAAALGLSALATTLRDRSDEGFQPVASDLVHVNPSDHVEWSAGHYDPRVFKGQGAVAVRRVMEDGADQYRNPENYPLARMNPRLAARMFELHTTTTPRNNAQAPVSEKVAQIAGLPTEAPIIDHGSGWRDESYEAFADTDPGHSRQ